MGRLRELLVAFAGEDQGVATFRAELAEVSLHPPRFAVERGALAAETGRLILQSEWVTVPVSELDVWASVGSGGPLPVSSLAVLATSPMVQQLRSGAQIIPRWGAFDWPASRVVIDAPARIAALPWEGFVGPDHDKLALLRRIPLGQGGGRPLTGRLRFALTAVGSSTPSLTVGDRQLLGMDFGAGPQVDDGPRWVSDPTDADLWHLVSTTAVDAEVAITTTPCPRVVVAQLTVPGQSDEAVARLAEATLTAGAWAVLVAQVPLVGPYLFFPTFYRKVFHNWPLEFCLSAAKMTIPPTGTWLYARPGGEVGLSLTRIPAEMVIASAASLRDAVPGSDQPAVAPADDAERPPSRRRLRWWRRRLRRFGDVKSAGPSETVVSPDATRATASPRRRRVAADLHRVIALASGSALLRRAAGRVAHGAELTFSGELYDLRRLTDTVQQLDQEARTLKEEGDRLAGGVAAATPDEPRFTAVTVVDRATRLPWPLRRALRTGAEHLVQVRIAPHTGDAQVVAAFDASPLASELRAHGEVSLHVVLFAPAADFAVADNVKELPLPRVGPSDEVEFAVTPLRDGWASLRVGIYRRNALLQSVVVEVFSASVEEERDEPTVRRALDWAATGDMQLLDDFAAPAFSLFSNSVLDGSHWIGLFSADAAEASLPLRSGQMRHFRADELDAKVARLRAAMQETHGTPKYLYPDAAPDDPQVVEFGRAAMVELAQQGWILYDSLFRSVAKDEFSGERRRAFEAALRDPEPGIISVAVCKPTWTLPWAAIYDKYLDRDAGQPLELCGLFAEQLARNTWDPARKLTGAPHDLLDDPGACRNQPGCPLNDEARRDITVCPFGFWGLRYQVEQPLQMVAEPLEGEGPIPVELTSEGFMQTSVIAHVAGEPVRIGGGVFPFTGYQAHMNAVKDITGVNFQYWDARNEVRNNLFYGPGRFHVVYFYCHGMKTANTYALQVGPVGEDTGNTISADNIDNDQVRWGVGDAPQPVVLLIACESAAARIEVANDMFHKLANVNASGVVGSEIDIGVRLGRESGLFLTDCLAAGISLGEALLALRRDLMRRHNPLGLALTANAPATLHLCADPDGRSPACARYHRKRGDAG